MMRRAALLLVIFQLGAAPGISAAPRQVTGAGFNYYVLSLYWLPTLCLESPDADECGGPSHNGFIVRGLRPVLDWNSPTNCGGGDVISDSLVAGLKDLLATRRVVEREWMEHGSCSGESPERFFALLRQAYASVNLPHLNDGGADMTQTTRQVTKAFTNRDPGLFAQAMSLTCSANPVRLQEVRICLSKNLASNDCTGETTRSSCTARDIQIPAGH